jgi:hypothetical protein
VQNGDGEFEVREYVELQDQTVVDAEGKRQSATTMQHENSKETVVEERKTD